MDDHMHSGNSRPRLKYRFRIPTSLTILPTFKCIAACKHCCFGCHPWVKGRIPQGRILGYIDQAMEMETIQLVVFSGGECFLLGKDLDRAISHAHRLGLMTRCVTNAFWAFSEEFALKRLAALREAGLTELNVSTGDYHQMYVPIQNVINAALAAIQLGMTLAIMVESRKGREFTAKHLLLDKRIAEFMQDPDIRSLLLINESPWIPMDSRRTIKYTHSMYISRANLHGCSGCDSVLNTIAIMPQEELAACCGLTYQQIPELHLGSLRKRTMWDLYADAVQDFLKIWTFIEGPEHIVAWAAEKDPTIRWEGRFAHKCQICRFMYRNSKVRKVIREYYREKVPDVMMRFTMLNQLQVPIEEDAVCELSQS